MPRSMFWTSAILGALLFSPTANASNGAVDALELLQGWKSLVGETIDISGCTITSATAELVVCFVKSKHDRPPYFLVDPSGMAPDDMARALGDCRSYVGYPICRVQLKGEVASEDGELKILHGSVSWIYPPRAEQENQP